MEKKRSLFFNHTKYYLQSISIHQDNGQYINKSQYFTHNYISKALTFNLRRAVKTCCKMGRIYFNGNGLNLFCLRKSYRFCSSISNTRQVWFLWLKHSYTRTKLNWKRICEIIKRMSNNNNNKKVICNIKKSYKYEIYLTFNVCNYSNVHIVYSFRKS